MFFTVKFGDDEEMLFNPDCTVQLLVDDIKRRCGCDKSTNIALLDEKLELVTIGERAMENGAHLFASRGTYYLLEVHKYDSETVKYVPLLSGVAESHPEILSRLEALSNPKARPESKNMRARRTGTRLTASTPKKKPSSSGGSTGVGDTRSKSKLK